MARTRLGRFTADHARSVVANYCRPVAYPPEGVMKPTNNLASKDVPHLPPKKHEIQEPPSEAPLLWPPSQAKSAKPAKLAVRNLNFFYGSRQALTDNNLQVFANRVTAIIGASGSGKSTHLRAYNRIYQMYPRHRASGEILI